MSEYNPIIYFISAIGVEIVKDVGKHIGRKAYEITASLREPIIELGISDYGDYQEIQNKLETNPEIKSEIEAKVRDNEEEFNELLQILMENPKLVINKFHSEGNEKVINIGTNDGTINM